MMIIWIFLSTIISLILGYVIVNYIDKGNILWFRRKITLWYCLWTGLVGILLFLQGIMNIPYKGIYIWLGIALVIGVFLFLNKNIWKKPAMPNLKSIFVNLKKWSMIDKILLSIFWVLFLYNVILWFVFVLQSPTYQDDAWGKWNLRAKVFFYQKSLVIDKTSDQYLWMFWWPYDFEKEKNMPLRSYPFWNNLQKMFVAENMWFFQDESVNVINPVFFVFLILAIMGLLSLLLKKRGVISIGILLLTFPYLFIHVTNPYVELFVSWYFTLATIFLFLTLQHKQHKQYMWLFWLSLLCLLFTKKEGFASSLVLGFIYGCSLLVDNYKHTKHLVKIIWEKFLLPLSPWIVFLVVWFGFLHYTGYAGIFLHHINEPGQSYFHSEIFSIFKIVIFEQGNYNLLWLFWILSIVYYRKKIRYTNIKYIFIAFLLNFLLAFYALATTSFLEAKTQVGINRALLPVSVLFVVLCGIVIFYKDDTILSLNEKSHE